MIDRRRNSFPPGYPLSSVLLLMASGILVGASLAFAVTSLWCHATGGG